MDSGCLIKKKPEKEKWVYYEKIVVDSYPDCGIIYIVCRYTVRVCALITQSVKLLVRD